MPHDLSKFLLCFGCQRGGTTWLERQLRAHPGFVLPQRKEIRYLDPLYCHDFEEIRAERIAEFCENHPDLAHLAESGGPLPDVPEANWDMRYSLADREHYNDDWYRSLFAECDNNLVTADFSPDYSLLPEEGVAHLARLLPGARLVFILRDPVDRIVSGSTYILRHYANLNTPEAQHDILEFTRTSLQRQFSDYRTILERFERHFGRERILILFHDDIALDPLALLRTVCNHLGTSFDPEWFNETLLQSVNRSPFIAVDANTWREVSDEMMPTLEWLAQTHGGHARKWLKKARARVLIG